MAKDKTTQAADPTVNTASATAEVFPDDMPEFANHVEQQLTFAPYWNPSPKDPNDPYDQKYAEQCRGGKGKWFHAMPMMLDDRDPNFIRWILQAERPIACEKGSAKKNTLEHVTVPAGEYFTISDYKALPLEDFIGLKVVVQVIGMQDVPGRAEPMWIWKLRIDPKDAALLTSERKARAIEAVKAYKAMRAAQKVEQLKNGQAAPAA